MKVIAKKNRELALINAQNTQNENRAETITLVVPEEYEDYNKKIVFVTDNGIVWDIIQDNTYKLTNAITKYDKVDYYIWLTKEVDGESIDFRTKTKTLNFYHNEDASDEITDEEIHGVNTVVNLLEEEIEKVENLNIEATKIGNTTTITITKKDGTTESVEINDGTDGQDGKDGKDGQDGQDGQPGQDGKDAKINGKNSIEIEAGNNITIDNTENGIRINSTGGSGGTSNYNDLSNKPKINNVELNGNKSLNDLGIQPKGNYLTSETDPTVPTYVKNITQANITSWNNKSDFSGNYNDLTNKPTIPVVPTNVSAFTNDVGYLTEHQDISGKQDITDNNLTTTNKTITSAINEVDSIAKGANQALSYGNYSTMITAFNSLANNVYNVGQNVMIITLQVPDLWISGIESTSQTYTYTTDEAFTTELNTNGYVQVGYYKLSALETQKVDLTNYVTNTDYATAEKGGTIRTSNASGLGISNGNLYAVTKSYNIYNSASGNMFIGKGTLENVITGKGLVSNTDYATYSNGGVIKVDGAFSTFITDGKLKCTLKTYGDYQNLSSYAFIGKGTLENVVAGKELDLKQLSTFDRTKTQVLKNINGTLTWVDES